LDPTTGKTRFSIATAAQPRTIALSKNQAFVFVTGYSSNKLEVFKITDSHFERVASLNCPGHPVGVDLYEDNDKIEAWVCSYQGGKLHIFSFDKD
jgi:DNA-binding beta-propeller fold protein YncE